MQNGRRRGGLLGLLRLAPVVVGGFLAALMIGGAATGALLTSSEASTDAPPVTDTVAGAVVAAADAASTTLTVDKVPPDRASPGQPIDYEIFVENTGTQEALGVVLVDVIPDGTGVVGGTLPEVCETKAWTGEYGIPNGTQVVVCTLGNIAGGDEEIVDLAFAAEAAGEVTNEVTVAADNADPVSDSAALMVTDPTTGILLQKEAPTLATVGAEFTYTLTVKNVGDVVVNEVSVDDDLPEGIEFVRSASGCVAEGASVSCTLGTIATGVSKPASFVVKAATAGKKTNSATATGKGADGKDVSSNDDAETTVSAEAPAVDVSLDKSAPSTAVTGTPFTYTLKVTNLTAADATDVEIEDDLPAGLTFVSSADGCESVEGVVTCDVGSVAADGSKSVTFSVTASIPGEVANTATVHATGDNNGGNNSDAATTTVSEAPTSGEKVLIYGPTNSGALRAAADRAGFDYDIKEGSEWSSMTTEQFESYRAILIGDPSCGSLARVADAEANRSVWGAAVDGNVIIDGTDPEFHGKDDFTNGAVAFAAAAAGRTGAYISLSCYYWSPPAPEHTPVPLLDPFGTFTTDGVEGCFDDAHIVAEHPALSGIDDAYLSDWGCSVHEAFDAWPTRFSVLAIARNVGSAYTATDGTVGTPYILARGEGLTVISNVTVTTDPAPAASGTTRTVTATVKEDGVPVAGRPVTFRVIEGPNVGTEATFPTDANGVATFAYTGTGVGTDVIEASYVDSDDRTQTSNRLFVTWTPGTTTTPPPSGGGGGGSGGGGSGGGSSSTTTTTTTTTAPLPPLPPPSNPQELSARVVMGQVLVNGQPFTGASLKVGDVVDTTRGTLEIRSTTGSLLLYDGAFRYTLDGAVPQFELAGGDFSICQSARRAASKGADERPVRRLWGKGTGSFKTKARFSSATVRGTLWLTEDRCDGSLIQTNEGTVEVFDYSLRRLLLVPAGASYLAQAPPPPTPGRFVGTPTGTVLINGQPLTQYTQVRNGDTVDVRKGRLLLQTTSGAATFYSGRFVVTQANSRSAYTILRLDGGNFATACGARRSVAAVDKAKPKKSKRKKNSTAVRSLWGDGTGKFRTQARYSTATVRGTVWLTVDRCDGSLVRVVRGRVEVRDFTQEKTVFVNGGGQYLAPAPG